MTCSSWLSIEDVTQYGASPSLDRFLLLASLERKRAHAAPAVFALRHAWRRVDREDEPD
jgi:hypothetical protein